MNFFEENKMETGRLRIHVFKGYTSIPIGDAKIIVLQNKEASNKHTIYNLFSDSSGIASNIELEAPPLEYSLKPSAKQPYSLCKIIVEVPGYKKLTISGCQIYPGITSIQHCYLNTISPRQPDEDILNISANTLFGNFQPKIAENSMPTHNISESGESFAIPLAEQKIPRSIIVHDGHPDNKNAPNFKVYYKEYLKNVMSSEIYPTWPVESLKANAYAIISFTLNRVFTEWYWAKGKKFHVTSSTATDHKYTPGIGFSSVIEGIVDEVFSTYIKKTNYGFPLLSQYTDGIKVPHRSGWMTQWGSKKLADDGKTAFEILKYYYGSEISIFKTEKIGDISESYPGYSLQIGTKGEPVKNIQTYLNVIAKVYSLIPKVNVDGNFGNDTKKAVETFQIIFSLTKTGIVDYSTWYKISDIFVALSKS